VTLGVVQSCPGVVPGAKPLIRFFAAASEGAAETAIAVIATAPTSSILVMDFMTKTPSVLKTVKSYMPKGA